ncbi:hypothetical protein [Streptomyces sp. NPDC050504]|uniref:hypothetical protein n=1 Tax=Streptomyces sp. NPDC050504 TaxID=3365618 RepID=UPI0037A098DD
MTTPLKSRILRDTAVLVTVGCAVLSAGVLSVGSATQNSGAAGGTTSVLADPIVEGGGVVIPRGEEPKDWNSQG